MSWMVNEFIHWPKSYFLLSPTCDEVYSWVIGIWMKIYSTKGNNCNTANLSSQIFLQGVTNNVGLTFEVSGTTL
jgi:hypothetical protein